ncbi:MAG: hypothetical protein HZB30_03905 [Nitrospirae bacterium]|nr:hypothetical protein [Nitrospirota bacterium]
MKKLFLIILATVVILFVSLLAFIKSPSFLKVAANFINTHTSLYVEIGSLSFGEGNRIIIKDLVIEEKKKDGFQLILPYSEIRANLKGIIRKNIEELILVKPRLSFAYKKEKKGATSLPFTFNKLSVTDADVTLQLEKGKSFHVHPITISLDKLPNGKDAELRGSAFISELGSTVSLTAEIVTGELNAPEVRGELSLRGERLAWKGIKLQSFAMKLPFEYKEKQFKVKNLSIDTDFAKGVTGDIFFVLNKQWTIDAIFKYNGIDVEKLSQTLFHDFLGQKGLNVKGGGALQVVLKVTIPENSTPQISGTAYLNLLNAGFSSSDGVVAGEGIDMKVSNSFEFLLPAGRVDFTLYSEAANFELLIGRFYGNFRDKVLSFSAKGNYTRANNSLNITESKTALTHTGNIFISGNISGLATSPLFNADIKLDSLQNKEVYNFFIRETFQEQFPIFSQLDVNGESSMRLSVRGTPKYFTVSGEVNIADMNILGNSPDKALKEINIHLPVELSFPQDSHPGGRAVFGFLKMKALSWSALKLKDIEIFPSVWHNAVLFKEDIKLPVLGGDIVLKNILYSDIFSPEKQLRLSVDIQGLDLEQASTAMTWPRFSGRLSGVIPMVNLADNHLITDGKIILELFDGKIKVSNLSVDNVFGPVSSFKSSIELEEIDLGKLTGAFDFGHISGIIKGNITELVIVKGQAESFKAYMETYKKKGVEQKISVDALKKISILGTGSSTSILDRGIYQFFKEYRYDKLGFKAFLKNDKLLLLGIENEGNKEYLVKGGLFPPKVDVISYTQNVSFQEMVSRLKRIKQAEK